LKIYIVIPAHNEEDNIGITLSSLVNQELKPAQVVVVNDNSTDKTSEIVEGFTRQFSWIKQIYKKSSDDHLPGEKIIEAFYHGYEILGEDYEIICKYDADMVFKSNYLLRLSQHFEGNNRLGMVAGQCYTKKDDQWILENPNKDDHIRGALKAYRKECFLEIGKIARSIGWDTLDELMAQYYGWELKVDNSLKVKHLKPTGFKYSPGAAKLQGVATYRMRLSFLLTVIIGLKHAWLKQEVRVFFSYIKGFLDAKRKSLPFIVDAKQGEFIRSYRWRGILQWFKTK